MISEKFNIIYMDPPWTYRNKRTGGSMKSGAAQKYDTLTVEELQNFPITDIAETNAVLFMWCTTPLLPEAFEVLSAWPFRYKTMLTWRKIMSKGMGFWFRIQTEHLMVAIRGNIKAFRCQKSNFRQEKVRKHSQKPDYFRALIEEATQNIENPKRIELFATETFPGWSVWGNEVESDIELEI